MFFTPKHVLADDVAAALAFIKARHEGSGPITLVGHSSGGGLSQHVVDSGKGVGVGKLVVLAGIPSFGGWRVYVNWFKLDPWFPIRILRDFYHPRSPLSTTRLVHNAFFSPTYPVEKVQKFEAEMSPYESMLWPSGMMFPFISCARVLKNLLVTCPPESKKRVPLLAISGAQDTLVSHPIMRRMVHVYAATNVGVRARVRDISSLQYEGTSGIQGEKEGEGEAGVWFAEIAAPGAGHNLMRDDGWERCARVLEAFLDA
ncbi:hypothetical protein BDV93DRAFT_523434 [Ceratobasidium sp. AG-I]|nr:hypothetical protein BDV93DRAFT_523434 [Ceratobasidium sp. AG-I]